MTCYVCEYGWIICGKETNRTATQIHISGASVVRRWDNGKGIGGIAKKENRYEYVLDEIGDVVINSGKVLFEIPCDW